MVISSWKKDLLVAEGNANLSQDLTSNLLEAINGIKFTSRELDVIACVLSGRPVKTIASFLSIAPKTVEHHVRSIMLKLGCNSQEGIRDFIEKSGKFLFIRKHYQDLLIQVDFRKRLKEIFALIHSRVFTCCLHYRPERGDKISSIHIIEEYLRTAGVKIVSDKREDIKFIENLVNSGLQQDGCCLNHVICVVSDTLIREFYANNIEISELLQEAQNHGFLTFLSLSQDVLNVPQEFHEIGYINLSELKNYYLAFFEILKKLIPDKNIDKIATEFINYHELVNNNSKKGNFEENIIINPVRTEPITTFKKIFSNKRQRLIFTAIFFISIFCFGFWTVKNIRVGESQPTRDMQEIRSDLLVPAKNTFLERPLLTSEIEKRLEKQKDIRTVALVGIGGSGKTTLARQYLRSQKYPIVWELNAETKESLVRSFDNLAYVLSRTSEEREELNSIQKIEDSQERSKRILFFVKRKLKQQKNWCLLFDNVEALTDIKEFYPLDTEVWGAGDVIVTTRDGNIKNNNYVNPDNIILIGELNEQEKLILLVNIIFGYNFQKLNIPEQEQIKNFLKEIPSFPLDVSMAAYYIKDTGISYEEYLEKLRVSNVDFEKNQEILLQEISEYTKTRYGIIVLTLNHIINKNPNFKSFLLFVGLLDSQAIPVDLLESYGGDVIRQFVHELKKHSFITSETFNVNKLLSTFSIHRSTQEISLTYLKRMLRSEDYDNKLYEFIKVLTNYIDRAINKLDYEKIMILLRHGELFLSRASISNKEDSTYNLQKVKLLRGLGVMYKCGGDFEKSRDILYKGYLLYKSICKTDDHVEIAEISENLGSTYESLGDHENAKNFLEQGLSIRRKNFGNDHTRIGWDLVQLGNVYRSSGDYEKAKAFLEHGLDINKKYFGNDHIETAWAMVHLGSIHDSLGNYEKAKDFFEQGLVVYKKHLGENHVKTGWALIQLGNAYRSLGYYEKAKVCFEKSLIINKRCYGDNHTKTGWVLVQLGKTYGSLGDYEKAKVCFEKGIAIYSKKYGENHVRTGWILVHLGKTYRCLGNYSKAEPLLEQGLTIYEKHFGKDHIETAWSLLHLGNIYRDLGKYEEAKKCFEKSLVIYKAHYQQDHIRFAEVFLGLGQTYFSASELKEAESLLNESFRIFKKNNHPKICLSLEALVYLYIKKAALALNEKNTHQSQDLTMQAMTYLKQALEAAKTYFPKNSPHVKHLESLQVDDRMKNETLEWVI